jgi:hypothetical protein
MHGNSTLSEIAGRVREFLFDEKVAATPDPETWMRVRVCGYSSGRPLAEVWEVLIQGQKCDAPALVQGEDVFGPRWDGEYEALDRLILGLGTKAPDAIASAFGIKPADLAAGYSKLTDPLAELVSLPAMPVQDAIDLARFMVEITTGFIRFGVRRQPKTVGGPVEIAAITKHEGFKWVQRRHFYPAALNP